uniref:DoxX family protein n=1 Tax=Candidatus Planktophila sp. TaxID=2175601 RepID=UPI004048FC89
MIRHIARTLLGIALTYAGITHLTSSRQEFQAQVPTILQSQADFVVIASGVVEILLGLSLILLIKYRTHIGWITAAFFIAIFPGNISQYINGTDAFGLNADQARAIRLLFQPLLVIWALWSTGAWKSRKAGK